MFHVQWKVLGGDEKLDGVPACSQLKFRTPFIFSVFGHCRGSHLERCTPLHLSPPNPGPPAMGDLAGGSFLLVIWVATGYNNGSHRSCMYQAGHPWCKHLLGEVHLCWDLEHP